MNENEYISWFKDTFYKDFTEDSLGRRWIDEITEKLSDLRASRDKWKADAERLYNPHVEWSELTQKFYCIHCYSEQVWLDGKWSNVHTPTCPITLHQLLIEEQK